MRKTTIYWLGLLVAFSVAIAVACASEEAEPTATTAPAVQPTATTAPAPDPTATTAPAAAMPGEVKDVPRDRTVKHIIGGREGKYVGHEIHNPYSTSAGETVARVLIREPLYYFSAFENKEIPWLATDWEYTDDFLGLTYKLRDGVTWSDGEAFNCDDVAYTYNTLTELGPKVRWGTDAEQFVEKVECTDDLTAVFTFKRPAPKWHHFISYKFDIGIHLVPEHVYSAAGDWTEFRDFDLDKGWPLSTGPWSVVAASPEQIVFDRVASEDDWWASRQGYWKFPQVERFIQLPLVGGATQAAQSLVKNEVDTAGPGGLLSVALHEEVQAQNPKIITHNLREKPYGFLNWYTANIEINNERPPFDDKNVRWAISLFLDREKMIDTAFKGAGSISRVPWPAFAGLQPFTEAIEHLLQGDYPTDAYDPEAGAARLRESGWEKNSDGMWEKDGELITCDIIGYASFAAQGPVIAELLRQEGIDASYSMPPDFGTRRATGDYSCATAGHGGSVGDDPYFTFRLYLSQHSTAGTGNVNVYRYSNPEFDAIIEEMAEVPNTDQEELKRLTVKAMEIWLDELPDVQLHDFYQAPAINTCYWENWPTYANGRQGMSGTGHLTYNLALYELEHTGGC